MRNRWENLIQVMGIMIIVAGIFFLLSEKMNPASTKTAQQMDGLGQPTVTPFEPEQEFVVTNSSDGRIVIAESLSPFVLATIRVKRTSGGIPFQVATEIRYEKGTKVKLFKVSWKENPSVTLPPVGFKFALPIEGAKP